VRREAWPYTLVLAAYLGALLVWILARNPGSWAGVAQDAFFVLILPHYTFQTLLAAVLYYQHTHPAIPWFSEADGEPSHGQEDLTVHIKVPRILGALSHDPFCHAAHHVCPAIPCYRLNDAQTHLSRLLGERRIEVPLSWPPLQALRLRQRTLGGFRRPAHLKGSACNSRSRPFSAPRRAPSPCSPAPARTTSGSSAPCWWR
jgi:fatty acid desaturase